MKEERLMPELKTTIAGLLFEIQYYRQLIGVGGISRAQDALEMMFVGASEVQICTAAILEGNGVFQKVVDGIDKYLNENNYQSINQLEDR